MAVSVRNSGKQAPKWYRIFKKIFSNTENTVISVLLLLGYTSDSLVLLLIKIGSSFILENVDTIISESVSDADYIAKDITEP